MKEMPEWKKKGFSKDPDKMTPEEREKEQIRILNLYLWRLDLKKKNDNSITNT